jgi:hypothetical protein
MEYEGDADDLLMTVVKPKHSEMKCARNLDVTPFTFKKDTQSVIDV